VAKSDREETNMTDRGNGIYISSGAIALIIIIALLIWLL